MTDISEKYRIAERKSMLENPSILGYEINLSSTKSLKANKKRCDLCKVFAGNYPLWFKWKGWCDNCLCYMTPILMDDEHFSEYLLMIAKGEDTTDKIKALQIKAGIITMPPNNFMKWIKENIKTKEDYENAPYFVRDNFKMK